MKLKRIAYVIRVFPKLSETFIVGEIAEVLKRGIEVRILSLVEPEENMRHKIVDETKLLQYASYDPKSFKSVLEKFKPDLIHAHFARGATHEARTLSKTLGIPFTFTAHGYDIYRKPPPDFSDRAAAAKAVITVSKPNADYIEKHFNVPPDKIHLISCGVDTDTFKPPKKRTEFPVIVCVARLKPVKNLTLLLEACAILNKRQVPFRCVLIGGGPCHDELNTLKTRLGLEKILTLLGDTEQTQVLKWWQEATIGALSSNIEGMPVCLMEAGACGVPVVATDVGGISDMVEHGVTGLITPPGDAPAFASALEKLLNNPEQASQMGKAARKRIEERFSLTHQVDRLMLVWNQIVDHKKTP